MRVKDVILYVSSWACAIPCAFWQHPYTTDKKWTHTKLLSEPPTILARDSKKMWHPLIESIGLRPPRPAGRFTPFHISVPYIWKHNPPETILPCYQESHASPLIQTPPTTTTAPVSSTASHHTYIHTYILQAVPTSYRRSKNRIPYQQLPSPSKINMLKNTYIRNAVGISQTTLNIPCTNNHHCNCPSMLPYEAGRG